MPVSIDDIAKQMLVLLPEDGAPVLNRVMRVMLARALSADIDEKRYLVARQRLIERGQIGVTNGQGGRLFLKLRHAARPSRSPAPPDRWAEASLMPWLQKYLEGPVQQGLDILRGARCLTFNTSKAGRPGAQWARPDYTLISVKRFRLLPGLEVDVHSFELKTESGGATDLAVFETLAQTRFTNFGYLVWHLPAGSTFQKKLPDIEKQCSHFGIGFIRAREPQQFETWDILVEPMRKSTPAAEIDLFLDERLQDAQRKQFRSLLNGAPG